MINLKPLKRLAADCTITPRLMAIEPTPAGDPRRRRFYARRCQR